MGETQSPRPARDPIAVGAGLGCLALAAFAFISVATVMWSQADCWGTCAMTRYWFAYRFAPFLEAGLVVGLGVLLRRQRRSLRLSVWCVVVVLTVFVIADFFAGAGAPFVTPF